MKASGIILTIAVFLSCGFSSSAQDGEKLYKTHCASCHALGQRLIGPDLIGVNERRSEEWLLKWIKSSQTVVKSGDETAVNLFNEFNKIPMPDAIINEGEIKAVLTYVKTKTAEKAAGGGTPLASAAGNPADSVAQQVPATSETGNLFNQFSFAEYLLLFLCVLMLIVIWILVRTINSLSDQLSDKYRARSKE